MLDALSDFWKPSKKNQPQEKLRPELLQVGSTMGFGFMPQPSLSGRRLTVTHVNTYQFGDEALTSFVLAQDKDAGVSMIVAESDGEQYLAISRRIPLADRMKMFDANELEAASTQENAAQLRCREMASDFKGWLVPAYKREIYGMEGRIFRGDYRKAALPASDQAQPFQYTLLVSDGNEHAIEIERFADGRVEMYATIYRRTSDIGEITHPPRTELNRPDLKLASQPAEAPPPAASTKAPSVELPAAVPQPAAAAPAEESPAAEPLKLQEFAKTPMPETIEKPETPQPEAPQPPSKAASTQEEKKPMQPTENYINGADKTAKPQTAYPQEIKAVNKQVNGMENESIECDLRVANKIIDEAIRNEMRLSDVVRRIVELPVAHQEAVQIPVTLSEEDYSLLAIRYGMSAADRHAIKKRIIEDLNSFSGKKAA
jgi:hypothetical protein